MKLSKELSDKIKYDLPAEVVEMRFELFDWLKEKGLHFIRGCQSGTPISATSLATVCLSCVLQSVGAQA